MTKTNERIESAKRALETCAPEMGAYFKNELAAAKAERRGVLASAAKFVKRFARIAWHCFIESREIELSGGDPSGMTGVAAKYEHKAKVLKRAASRKKALHCPGCNQEFTGGITSWSCVDKMFNQ